MQEDFNATVAAAFARHTEFKPRTIEVAKLRAQNYEKRPEVKAKHKAWAQSEAGKKSMRERCKRYAAAHPERIKAKQQRIYRENRERELARSREYRATHSEEIKEKAKAYREKEKLDPIRHERRKQLNRECQHRHREQIRAYAKRYRDAHKDDPEYKAKQRERAKRYREQKKLKEQQKHQANAA